MKSEGESKEPVINAPSKGKIVIMGAVINTLVVIILILSHLACAFTAYTYRSMQCNIEHAGASASAEVALFSCIPFVLGILGCGIVAIILAKQRKKALKLREAEKALK